MKFAGRCLLYCSMIALLSLPSAQAGEINNHSKFAGIYFSHAHDGGKAGPSMGLSLGRDGTATVTEDFGSGTRTLFGHWAESASGILVTFETAEGQPPEAAMAFEARHEGLQAVTWNRAQWGKVNPPPMQKGYKVKQLYWLTEGP